MTSSRPALLVRPRPDLYQRLARYAALSQRSLSNAAIVLLERALSADDTAKELEIHGRTTSD